NARELEPRVCSGLRGRSSRCKDLALCYTCVREMASGGRNLICRCYVVDEDVIRKAIAEHQLRQVEEVTAVTRAGGGCSSCWDDIQAILSEIWGKPAPRDVPDESGLSSAQKRALIVKMLDREVHP